MSSDFPKYLDCTSLRAELLDLLDSIQLAGVGEDILPQIVVVGDQSSGKSSALTALTGIEFPRHQTACTQFATEIRLRRSSECPQHRIRAWILLDKTAPRSDEERQALENFGKELAIEKFLPPGPHTIFASKDKLVIEKSGPNLPALTLVDLPGLVKNANERQTTADLKLIEELSDIYMKDPASIILAVVSGAYEFVNAAILDKVTQWDPEGARTLGLLTKPDAADREHITEEFIKLMMRRDSNKQYHFQLGWHVLLNPDASSRPTMQERKQREAQYWIGSKWAKLPAYMRGADALRSRLSRHLQNEIARRLPAIQERIQEWEHLCVAGLGKLGPVLVSERDKAKELGRLFSLSHQLIQQAVYGTRINPPGIQFFPDEHDPNGIPAQNLRAIVVAESDTFESEFRLLGLRARFTDKSGKVDVKAKREFAKRVVEPFLPQIQGRQLPGDPDTRAPYLVFKRYSKQWHHLARAYEQKIERACVAFLAELKECAWPPRTREPLEQNHLRNRFTKLWKAARNELETISWETFQLEIPPFDREYNKCIAEAVKPQAAAESGNQLSDAEKVVEQMFAYYMLAERVFIRNVIYQVAERHLLSGMMRLFETAEVMGMTDEIIDKIIAEDEEAKEARRVLELDMERIQDARKKCDVVAARTSPRLDIETMPDDAPGDEDYPHNGHVNPDGLARSEDGDSRFVSVNNIVGSDDRTPRCT
ncbi:dynamin family protein [Lasiosphaeris hirsuta]|uniref:Dynamin family protein n=1 Tax=Lasiosphaeris hirsuta TaxID=260670 RepID=A0AA40AZZ6_9PEZI|nr:dynamin family protein [Lasiosphaeris hirsuta]